MKKLLLVLAIAGFAVACNNDSSKKETKDSTTTMSPDTTKMAPVDTTMMTDTTKKDTTKM
ncbi:MAG TPA: hypothetical protein VKC90_11125 [Chitinophagaceae bacterium]|nr:hypothetical protein [Chitinophagaceae bacterium]